MEQADKNKKPQEHVRLNDNARVRDTASNNGRTCFSSAR